MTKNIRRTFFAFCKQPDRQLVDDFTGSGREIRLQLQRAKGELLLK